MTTQQHTPAVERLIEKFEKVAKELRLREETISGVGEWAIVKNLVFHAYAEGIRTSMAMFNFQVPEPERTEENLIEFVAIKSCNEERARILYTLHDVLERVEPEIISNEK